jgi:cyclic pyranopterin phosphate synthase
MRDVTRKINTHRTAIAKALVKVSPPTIDLIKQNKTPKPDVLQTARVAGIQAAKNTSQIIPYCHPLPITHAQVDFVMDEDVIEITCQVKAIYKTGVEMEALTGASVAALTVYDMVKAVDDLLAIESIHLMKKTGGKSSFKKPTATEEKRKAVVIVMSDSVSAGKTEDISGKLIVERLEEEGLEVIEMKTLPDDEAAIFPAVRAYADESKVDLIITTGGTGISPRDNTTEAVSRLIERELPGVTEAIRAYGQERNPYAMLSRSCAGVRNKTVIICLPGSTGGVQDGMDAIFPAIFHSFSMLAGEGHELSKKREKTAT